MLGFPGFGRGHEPSPSDDPALPPDLVGPYAADRAGDLQTGAQKDALLSGDIENKVEHMLEGVLTSLAAAALSQMDKATPGVGRVRSLLQHAAGAQASPHPSTPPGASDAGSKAPSEPSSGPQHYHPIEGYKEAYERGKHMTMGGVARAVAAPAARYFSEHTPNWTEETVDGVNAYVRRGPDGQVVEQVTENDPNYASVGRRIRMGGFIGGNLTAFAAGEGAVGSLGAFAARAAGPVGLAVGGTMAVGNFLEEQNQSAATYRAAYGEQGTGMFAARERFGEFMAGIGGFGTLGGDRAREQYQAASGLGLRGTQRDQATDFMGEMYMRFGMDTAQSMQLVQQAVQGSNVSLTQFSEAIEKVSRSAVEAGRSSQQAIEGFAAAQKAVGSNLVAGGTSVAIAQNLSGIEAGLPRELSSSIGGAEGLANMLTQNNVMMAGAMSGQSPTAALWNTVNPATGEIGAADALGGLGQILVQVVASQFGMSRDALSAKVREMTNGEKVSYEEQHQIFFELAGRDEARAGQVWLVMQKVASQFGPADLDAAQIMNYFFEACLGNLGYSADQRVTAQNNIKAFASRTGKIGEILTGSFGGGGGDGGGSAPASDYEAIDPADTEAAASQRMEVMDNLGLLTQAGPRTITTRSGQQGAVTAYLDYVNKTGQQNLGIEALLNPKNQKELMDAGDVSNIADVRYRVGTGSNRKEMSLEEIIASGNRTYLAQLSSGAASVVPGNDSDTPKSVGEVTGVRVELELTGEAADVLRQRRGPSDEQRQGIPPSRMVSPGSYPRYGGR